MLSRAHLLIERDYERFLDANIWGIEASPLRNDNIFEWTAKIDGLPGSFWEGGVLRLYLKFSEHYNIIPPEICFHTIPYHPNVDAFTGKPCLEALTKNGTTENPHSLTAILQSIQSMLSNPDLHQAVNHEARDMLRLSPITYRQMVQDCVAASQRLEAGFSPYPSEPHDTATSKPQISEKKVNQERQKTCSARIGKVSFEDYHVTWSGIATSKSHPDQDSAFEESLKDKTNLQTVHYGMPVEVLNEQRAKKKNEEKQLMYGKFRNKKGKQEEDDRQAKLDHINQMRKIYLQPRTPRKTPAVYITEDLLQVFQNPADRIAKDSQRSFQQRPRATETGDEAWEHEVDDLVAWSNNLDEAAID